MRTCSSTWLQLTRVRNAEVRGSTPLCSTNNSHHSNYLQLHSTWSNSPTGQYVAKNNARQHQGQYAIAMHVKGFLGLTSANNSISIDLLNSCVMGGLLGRKISVALSSASHDLNSWSCLAKNRLFGAPNHQRHSQTFENVFMNSSLCSEI